MSHFSDWKWMQNVLYIFNWLTSFIILVDFENIYVQRCIFMVNKFEIVDTSN